MTKTEKAQMVVDWCREQVEEARDLHPDEFTARAVRLDNAEKSLEFWTVMEGK